MITIKIIIDCKKEMNSEDVAGKGGGASKDPFSKPSHDNNL